MFAWLFYITMKLTFLTLISCFLSVLFSCSRPDNETLHLMNKAEAFLETRPDSALYYLDLIAFPENLPEKTYDDYLLLHIQAKDKNREDISGDTTIFQLKNKYLRTNPEKEAMISLYIGKVYQAQKDYEQALVNFLDAEIFAIEYGSDNLNGLIQASIGTVFYYQAALDQSIERMLKANDYFLKDNNLRNIINSNNLIGNIFLRKKQPDSTFYYYNQSVKLVENQSDAMFKADTFTGLGVAYRTIKEYDKAKEYFYQSLQYPVSDLTRAKVYYNLAQTYLVENERDSFQICIDKALSFLEPNTLNLDLRSNIYNFISTVHEQDMDYQNALLNHKLYINDIVAIYDDWRSKTLFKTEKKYNYQVLQNHNQKLLIQRQNLLMVIIVIVLAFVLIFLYFYRKNIRNLNALLEAEAKIAASENLSISTNESSLREVLARSFKILTKVPLLEPFLKNEEREQGVKLLKKVNSIVYGNEEMDWEPIYEVLNAMYKNIATRLKEAFPQLDESEYKICCLSLGKLSNSEVSLIMKYSVNTVQMKRTAIRKKLGIDSKRKIDHFLAEYFDLPIEYFDK